MSGVTDALDHASRLLRAARPPVDTQAPTEQYETLSAGPGEATLSSPVPGAPTLPVGGGPTDVEVGPHASKITAVVELLILSVQRLAAEQAAARAQALSDPRVTHLAAEVADVRVRHDRLRDTVQDHGSRLDSLDEVALEMPHLRFAIRLVLVGVGAMIPLVLLVLGGVAVLVARG